MKSIALAMQKGGPGKTTLCLNLAVHCHQMGRNVLVIDLDPQQTASRWYQKRDSEKPRLVRADATTLQQALQTARQAGYDMVFMDTKGHDNPATAKPMELADLTLIPCRPSPMDIEAVAPTVATFQRLGKPAAFVISQAPSQGFRADDTRKGLAMASMVAPTYIRYLMDFQDAYGAGLGVTEFNTNGAAAGDIRALWQWVAGKLEKL